MSKQCRVTAVDFSRTLTDPVADVTNHVFYGLHPVKFFSNFNYFIFGYLDPTNNFFDNKNKLFLG